MSKKNVRGAVLWGILGGAILYYLLGFTVPGFYADSLSRWTSPFTAFGDFGTEAFGKVFTEGFDFSAFAADARQPLTFVLVDHHDRSRASAWSICSIPSAPCTAPARAAICWTKDGEVPEHGSRRCLPTRLRPPPALICGTSTVTTFVESSAGVAEGGTNRSFLYVHRAVLLHRDVPLARSHSSSRAALPPLRSIYVGVLMMACVKEMDWHRRRGRRSRRSSRWL